MTSNPVHVDSPRHAGIALVCDSPHSGTDYPSDFDFAVERSALRRSEDTHVDALWESVSDVGGTLISARFPRSYIDPNRDLADVDLSMLDGEWPHPVQPMQRSLELGMGLIWRLTPLRQPIYARRLRPSEVVHRIETCWQPYRQALQETLEAVERVHGGWWHLNLHSMPSNAYERLGLAKPHALADVVLGDRHGTTCSPEFLACVQKSFTDRGYRVAVNDPYAGVELVRRYGQPQSNRHSLQIELNRALYMDENTRERNANFEHLQADIRTALTDIAAFVKAAGRG